MEHQATVVSRSYPMPDNDREEATFFLASPDKTLFAEGISSMIPTDEGIDATDYLSKRVIEKLSEAKRSRLKNPIAVGVIPFDKTKPPQLVIPKKVVHSNSVTLHSEDRRQIAEELLYECREIPESNEFMAGVECALEKIHRHELSKIVLSRTLNLTLPNTIDQGKLLQNLAVHNTKGYTFFVDLLANECSDRVKDHLPTQHRTLLGASPELLVSRNKGQVLANPLAGSAARSDDPKEDQRRAEQLLYSSKDLHEHAVVVEAVVKALRPFCSSVQAPKKPSLLQTSTMWHLSSEIRGGLIDPQTNSLDLALALHPTPAVCGTPTESAKSIIQQIEPYDRGYYSGLVGWCDSAGDGEWIVTIRCAEVEGRSLRLFAGAGVVEGSIPEDEWKETSAKFQTMLQALGIK